MTPLQRYQRDIQSGHFYDDTAQRAVVQQTERLHDALVARYISSEKLLNRLFSFVADRKRSPIKGLYLWGGVGRGKTYLVDAFFLSLPFDEKKRIHFHRFMQKVHHELKSLEKVRNPLQVIADRFREQTEVICFDEFHVSDITDAMLLGGLLKALFERGIVLVATSNDHPDELYRNGLQRERFLPAIELIKTSTDVIHVDGGVDYRLRYLDQAEIYHWPLDEQASLMLQTNFEHIAPDRGGVNRTIEIEGRKIEAVRRSDGVVWFNFPAVCDGPRSAADYIEIGRQYQTVFIANVPRMDDDMNDQATRFMALVDEFYDRNVKLILTAEAAPPELYTGKRLAPSFQRTVSRLIEMQSRDYLARRHLP